MGLLKRNPILEKQKQRRKILPQNLSGPDGPHKCYRGRYGYKTYRQVMDRLMEKHYSKTQLREL